MQITARNVNEALYRGVMTMKDHASAHEQPSRNGPVIEYWEPVITKYNRPYERVLFSKLRDANPLFHFFEALWMIGGLNDLKFVSHFVKNMKNFSDDGKTLDGSAYGYRWRHHFADRLIDQAGYSESFDQLEKCIQMLKRDPNDRRVVLQMWDPRSDLDKPTKKDLPCNTAVYFRVRKGALDMTVSNRSNDMIWGAYGANAVHFSALLEYVAGRLGLVVGSYYQMSNSFHVYLNNPFWEKVKDGFFELDDPYQAGEVTYFPMFDGSDADRANWDLDLKLFFEDPAAVGFQTKFFRQVVKPLWFTHEAYKAKDFAAARDMVAQVQAPDWKRAVSEWLDRREKTRTEGGE